MSIDIYSEIAIVTLWSALGVWCTVWLNVAVGSEPDVRTETENFDDMAW